MSKNIKIYCDGACKGNPNGKGGWGFVVYDNNSEIFCDSGSEVGEGVTNNRMELQAAICALEYLIVATQYSASELNTDGLMYKNAPEISKEKDINLEIVTDSKYVQMGITQWMDGWIKKGWRTSSNQAVKNKELWQRLLELSKQVNVKWSWVKGHSSDIGNDRADELASNAALNASSANNNKINIKNTTTHMPTSNGEVGNLSVNSNSNHLKINQKLNNTIQNIESANKKLQDSSKSNNSKSNDRFYIKVPYAQKDEAKMLGARWDSEQKSWFVPENVEKDKFTKWL